jgi:hypothetical protein
MTETDRKKRNTQRLTELYPTFAERVAAIIADLEQQGFRPRIQDAWRSPEKQLEAFKTGHSELRYGFHNVTRKEGVKAALAVDLLDDDHAANEGREYLLRLAATAEKLGTMTGIRFGLKTAQMRAAVDAAIAKQDWLAPVKIGWDPTHPTCRYHSRQGQSRKAAQVSNNSTNTA